MIPALELISKDSKRSRLHHITAMSEILGRPVESDTRTRPLAENSIDQIATGSLLYANFFAVLDAGRRARMPKMSQLERFTTDHLPPYLKSDGVVAKMNFPGFGRRARSLLGNSTPKATGSRWR